MFGDPHIKTLDGFDYTYNGWGEFVMMKMISNSDNNTAFELQARTERVVDENNTITNATIFSAFAGKDFNTGGHFEVKMTESKQGK